MQRLSAVLCAAALLAAMPVAASEADAPMPPAERFLGVWDLDGDGVLDAAEYEAFDAAREGDVAGYEGDARVLMQRITDGMSLSASDADGDGRVQRAEFIDGTQAWLDDLDRNGDGVITADDLAL